ncbi:glycoside hydrolase [Dendrothele bispora CBS 962.96]|uniref:alpha-L-fucosidase n=1 Tax=Dendrothele bispora (strain CBS 962.96) TaxID=1314807 RepID=A0A4V6T5N8_DENBC|nr:glycoside hydrolase [Dendrothele bispora CBS 962.96]
MEQPTKIHHLDNSKNLIGIQLANVTGSARFTGVLSIHVFAMTLVSSSLSEPSKKPLLAIQNVRSTTKFRTQNNTQIQLIEVTLNNFASSDDVTSSWITSKQTVVLHSSSGAIHTVIPGEVNRLRGGDQVRVIVGIVNEDGVEAGTEIDDVQVVINGSPLGGNWEIVAGIPDYLVGDESLKTHESPEWFDGAKFGLFVHWGIYSVPAWTVSGTQYAEWYWYWQHNPANASSAVWLHHKEVYGEDFLYDDFFPDFTASTFDANEFVQFVADIGAKYYVIVTKHHDGFALFDTGNSSNRNSLNYGPKRDLIGEILNATQATQPQLYNGLYFSLPEWFNPAYAKYGHADFTDGLYHRRSDDPNSPGYNILQRTGMAGGLAQNAYNSSAPPEPYTGYVEVDDFLQDLMKPQIETLFYKYQADILWCDVGGPSIVPDIAPAWYNWAKENDRQVVMNARCGTNYSDFDTPEYSVYSSLKTRKWESNEGSDPFSYGYNRNTTYENYRNTSYLVHSLVDIVSKNGNYLLDVGPTANGTIVPPSRESLLGVGRWLNVSGDAIYDTQYWFVTAEEGDLRFTTKKDAFYIISLAFPEDGVIRSNSPLPIKAGDKVTFLGPDTTGKELRWQWTEDGVFELSVGDIEEEMQMVKDAWAFKVEYR